MKRIFKYTLEKNYQQEVATKGYIMSAKGQGDDIVIYALVETEAPDVMQEVLVVGTGHELPDNVKETYRFIDTVKLYGGTLMFHIFVKVVR